MKKYLLIPTAVFPYAIVITILFFFEFGIIPESFAATVRANIESIGIGLAFLFILSIIMNIAFMIVHRKENPSKLITAALIVKCLHIPTYFLIFIFGMLLGIMFFMTMPLIIFLVFLDLITLWLSDMISIFAIVRTMKKKKGQQTALLVGCLLCQFFFCTDIISLIVLKLLFKKSHA